MGSTVDISQSAINSSGGGSGSRVIAKLENINLQDVAENLLDFIGSNLANNTGATNLVLKHVSGEYIGQDIPEVQGTGTFEVTSEANNPGGGASAVQIRVGVNVVSYIALDPAETKSIAQCKTDIINNAQGGWEITNPSGDIIELKEPGGQGGSYEGQQININNQLGVTFTIADATEVEGGSPEVQTAISLTQDSQEVQFGEPAMIDHIASLTEGKVVVLPIPPGAYSTSGNWALPVTAGTENEFIIDILILGDSV